MYRSERLEIVVESYQQRRAKETRAFRSNRMIDLHLATGDWLATTTESKSMPFREGVAPPDRAHPTMELD